MVSFDEVIGQRYPKKLLGGALQRGTLAHAYLFYGPSGVGKMAMAVELAKAVNCRGEVTVCGRCSSCRKISKYAHPDVRLILPMPATIEPKEEGKILREKMAQPYQTAQFSRTASISIERVRAIQRELSQRPYEGKKKVYIVSRVEGLSLPAANALLKSLEEPPPYALFILAADNIHALLPTIVSRCQRVRFARLSDQEVTEGLRKRFHREGEEIAVATWMAGGSLGAALEFLDRGGDALRRQTIDLLREGLEGDHLRLLSAVEPIVQGRDRELAERTVDLLLAWYRDVLIVASGGRKELVINRDRMADLVLMAEHLGLDEVFRSINLLQETKRAIKSNVNLHLALVAMLFRLRSIWGNDGVRHLSG